MKMRVESEGAPADKWAPPQPTQTKDSPLDSLNTFWDIAGSSTGGSWEASDKALKGRGGRRDEPVA